MVDFWQILGHAVTDDGFRSSLFSTFAGKTPAVNPNKTNPFACLFDPNDYNTARALVLTKMSPVSLMALGEWLVVSMLSPTAQTPLDNVAGVLKGYLRAGKAAYVPTNEVFYQTLGAAIVDTNFRNAFNGNQERGYGFNLSAPDRAALGPAIADSGFIAQAGAFHDICWDHSCKDMVLQTTLQPYAHALEDSFPKSTPAAAKS
jgi:hypothetical protein